MSPRLASIVVDYNGLADSIACVESLLAQGVPDHVVLVIDNGSTLDEAHMLQEAFGSQVSAIRLPRNLGYAGAANVGIRHAHALDAQYVWVLNNDTTIDPGAALALMAAFDEDPRIGLASPQIRAPVGPEAPHGVWFAGGSLKLWRARAAHRLVAVDGSLPPQDSSFLTGCALMIRPEIFSGVGLFWEPLFLYWEDADLILRAQAADWRTCVVSSAWIFHRIHGSADDGLASYFLFRNALLVAWRNSGTGTVAAATLFLLLRLARRWGRALARRGPAPWAAARGLVAGLGTVVRWMVSGRSRAEGIEVLS